MQLMIIAKSMPMKNLNCKLPVILFSLFCTCSRIDRPFLAPPQPKEELAIILILHKSLVVFSEMYSELPCIVFLHRYR